MLGQLALALSLMTPAVVAAQVTDCSGRSADTACVDDCTLNGRCDGFGVCQPIGGRKQKAPGTPCNDLDDCTANDQCDGAGVCEGLTQRQAGTSCRDDCIADGRCDDAGFCQPVSGRPQVAAHTGCDDGDDCTANDQCDGQGACSGSQRSVGSPCNDIDPCTVNDHCDSDGECVGSPANAGTPCDDGDPCGVAGHCDVDGNCNTNPLCADDGNPCTQDCVSGVCGVPDESLACSDANACTAGDHCSHGGCVGGGPISCDDSNECTADTCNPTTGCQHSLNGGCLAPVLALLDDDGQCDAGAVTVQRTSLRASSAGTTADSSVRLLVRTQSPFDPATQDTTRLSLEDGLGRTVWSSGTIPPNIPAWSRAAAAKRFTFKDLTGAVAQGLTALAIRESPAGSLSYVVRARVRRGPLAVGLPTSGNHGVRLEFSRTCLSGTTAQCVKRTDFEKCM